MKRMLGVRNRGEVVFDPALGRVVVDHHDALVTHANVEETGDPIYLYAGDDYQDCPAPVELPPLEFFKGDKVRVRGVGSLTLAGREGVIVARSEVLGHKPYSVKFEEAGPALFFMAGQLELIERPKKRKRKNRPVVYAGSGDSARDIWRKAEKKGLDPWEPFSLAYREIQGAGTAHPRRGKRRIRRVYMTWRYYDCPCCCGEEYFLFRNKTEEQICL